MVGAAVAMRKRTSLPPFDTESSSSTMRKGSEGQRLGARVQVAGGILLTLSHCTYVGRS